MTRYQERGQGAPGEDFVAAFGVGVQHRERRGMEGNKASLAKLRSTDRQNTLCPVHVLRLEMDRFPQPQTTCCQQPKKAVVGTRLQLVRRFDFQRRIQETPDFILRVNIRPRPLGTEPQQADGRDFGSGISAKAVASKPANNAQTAGPRDGLFTLASGGIFHCKFVGDVRRAVPPQKQNELTQALPIFSKFEPETATERKVVIDGLVERSHREPPGHGRASARSELRSTLA